MQVLILVEGQAEEAFIKNCLAPYLSAFKIYIKPVVVSTKRVLSGIKTTGGLNKGNLTRFLSDLNSMVNSVPPGGLVTTLVDYYALPENFPGYERLQPGMQAYEKADILQQALHDHINPKRSFLPYIQMYEFEAFLFAHPAGFESYLDRKEGNVDGLLHVIQSFDNPELINDKKETSPSHRIIAHYPSYRKVFLGNMMILEIGIETIIQKCPRFKAWIDKIIAFKS